MTVQEYAEKHDITERTVYRRIRDGRIEAEKNVDGTWTVYDGNDELKEQDNQYDVIGQLKKQVEMQEKQIDFLQQELKQSNQTIADMQERHDTIVLNLTKQVEQKTLALEDKSRIIDEMQNRSWWRRVKMALGFSGT